VLSFVRFVCFVRLRPRPIKFRDAGTDPSVAVRSNRLLSILSAMAMSACSSGRGDGPFVADTRSTAERPSVAARDPSDAPPRRLSPRRAPEPGTSSGAGPAASAEDRRTFDEVNRARADLGLPAFRWSERLFAAAYDHSREQHDHGYMGHGSPDPSRDDLGDRLRIAHCGRLSKWAEVVAMGYTGPSSVVLGWMNSRGHRKILTDPELVEAAFSRVGDSFTGDFATPMDR
jgi:uncharacterized protein YkwD